MHTGAADLYFRNRRRYSVKMNTKRVMPLFAGCALAAALLVAGCAKTPQAPVTVASFIDSEGAILGKMIVQLLEANKIPVVDKTEFGTPDVLRKALEAGELDLVVDYTGSGQFYHEGQDPAGWTDPQTGYELTRKLDKEKNDIIWLTPASANNTEMLAVKRDFAEKNGLKDMNDFARYVNSGAPVKLICSASFSENPLGLLGYEQAYGFKLREDQLISLSSGNTAEMLKALVDGTNHVNVSLVYGTDGALEQMKLMVLADPQSVPPVYLPTPVIRGPVLKRYPKIEPLLKPVFESLTMETLQTLNARVAYEGREAKAVAREYLVSKGFLKS
jgi:osmoprotectant transport system substrate-binding protein